MNNYIYEYYQKITDGTIIVGRWIKVWYQYIVEGLEKGLFHFDPKKAQKAIRFVENFCRHHEGALAPQLIVLELWQKALLSVLFGVMDATGHRQFREVCIIIARKNGKTLLAAAIAAYCSFLDGEYGGRIYFAAPKLEQAGLCYDAYYQMLSKDPELSQLSKKRRTDIYIANSNTSAKPLAFSAKKSDGLNVSLCVADEVASWPGDAGLKFYEVIKSSFGARTQPMLLSISTAGYVNEGIYDELIKRATRFLLGDSKETSLAPFLYMIDDPAKWNDINELAKANPNLGVSISVSYLLEEIAIAEGSLSKRAEFLTKYCNIKQNSSLAWLESDVVERACGTHIDPADFKKPYVVAADEMERINTNVFNYFGTNEDVLQNRAYGDAWSAFYEGKIEPFSIQFSDVATKMLFTERERAGGTLLMATANRLQYMSNTEKLNVSAQMADRGIMNRDEIREIWNLPPLPDGQGQAYTIRGEYYLLRSDGSVTKKGDDLTSGK